LIASARSSLRRLRQTQWYCRKTNRNESKFNRCNLGHIIFPPSHVVLGLSDVCFISQISAREDPARLRTRRIFPCYGRGDQCSLVRDRIEGTSWAVDGRAFASERTCSRLKCELLLQLLRTLSRTNGIGEPPAWGIRKSPLWAMAAGSLALILPDSGNSNSAGRSANGVERFGNMDMNHSRPYELRRDVDISIPRVVRVVRSIRIGLSRSAEAWRPLTDTATTKSEESSFQIGAFAVNHPIVAMVVLGLIAVIGFVCIFELPIDWLPF
jgi:hypothetical protein